MSDNDDSTSSGGRQPPPFPFTEEEVKRMNLENWKNQERLNKEYEQNHKTEPRPERTEYVIRCTKCGVVIMFGWAKGDPVLVADWRGVFKTLSKHQHGRFGGRLLFESHVA